MGEVVEIASNRPTLTPLGPQPRVRRLKAAGTFTAGGRTFEVEDGFADDTGAPNPDLPVTTMRVVLAEEDGVTRVVITSTFPSIEAMEQLISMGVDEGLREAMGQMDAILAA